MTLSKSNVSQFKLFIKTNKQAVQNSVGIKISTTRDHTRSIVHQFHLHSDVNKREVFHLRMSYILLRGAHEIRAKSRRSCISPQTTLFMCDRGCLAYVQLEGVPHLVYIICCYMVVAFGYNRIFSITNTLSILQYLEGKTNLY